MHDPYFLAPGRIVIPEFRVLRLGGGLHTIELVAFLARAGEEPVIMIDFHSVKPLIAFLENELINQFPDFFVGEAKVTGLRCPQTRTCLDKIFGVAFAVFCDRDGIRMLVASA